ncbi:MAG TPA: hypothetical protein VK846_19375 [Candidatus Limnocylindria bacterium]|nr:hypothetical protein [Candidatus Limnocylindria bacterium]
MLRVNGSHHFLQHPDSRRTVVPFTPAKRLARTVEQDSERHGTNA